MPTLTESTPPTANHVTPLPRADEMPDVYPKGRPCRQDGCITVLSMWNPGPYCYRHADQHSAALLAAEHGAERFVGRRLYGTDRDERDRLIRRLSRQGSTNAQLAATFELGVTTIGEILKRKD